MANDLQSKSQVSTEPRPTTGFTAVIDRLVESYHDDSRCRHLGACFFPSRVRTIKIIELLRRVLFPGFFDETRVTEDNVRDHLADLLARADAMLFDQVRQALRYQANASGGLEPGSERGVFDDEARVITDTMIEKLPELRRMLILDVNASFDGDPAATATDETIFCYPGIDAIFIHRLAHQLYTLEIPLLPRIMSEYAHNETGIDIHPGATIGQSFFIDHGTGVVIGETTQIGDRVKIYQGVTLGALSTKGGQAWRGRKRHPTLEDDVTIYPNATILGGETTIGARCVINGAVFLTHRVPPDHTVRVDHPEPQLKARRPGKSNAKV